ncbi:MAG: class II glutamine amidotransferase [Deltaproteobacteria bacterium]|nr:class II glutamine amidotransferase [Deltaproteobacteria bacterium]
MCRLFGFRSVIPSQVHRSLVAAENALGAQSARHPDGWGVAYYVDDAPHVMKSPTTALDDRLFHQLSGVVTSETVVAHVRRATVGDQSILNTHPFQHGRWVFAHNGEIAEFERCRSKLVAEVAPKLRRFVLGQTDSEVIFFLFLTELQGYGALARPIGVNEVSEALAKTVDRVRAVCDGPDAPRPSLLNLLVTNGATLAATREGKELFWSTYKNRCSDRASCAHLAVECEAPTRTGFVNHLIISSEPLQGENVWAEMQEGEIVGVDWRMQVARRARGRGPPQNDLRVIS